MNKIILVFPTSKALWDFTMVARIVIFGIDSNALTLTCACDDGEIEIAIRLYNAQIQNTQGEA
jgi:hypothetical protein